MKQRLRTLRSVLLSMAAVSSGGAIAAQPPHNLYATEAHYEHTRQYAGESQEIVETGTYTIASDGRYRVDRRSSDTFTFEIFDPVEGTRTIVNPAQERAFAYGGPAPGAMIPGSRRPQGAPVIDPDKMAELAEESLSDLRMMGNLAIGPKQEYLGTRAVGIIELEGVRQKEIIGNGMEISMESWFRFPGRAGAGSVPIAPILMEYRSMLPGLIEERRLIRVAPAYVSADIFDVPDSIPITRESPRRRLPSPPRR